MSSRCCRRYGDISARGQSFFKFSRLALHAINRNCTASLKMDVSEIVVSQPPANFAWLLMRRHAWQLVYFNCSMTPNTSLCVDNVLEDWNFCVCEWVSAHMPLYFSKRSLFLCCFNCYSLKTISKIMSMKRPLVLDPHINTISGIPRITSTTCNKVATSVAESSTHLI